MAQKLVAETLEMTKKGRADAATEGFNTEIFLLQLNAQIQKNLEHIDMLITGINEDAAYLEKRMSESKTPYEYGRDADTGKKVGKLYLSDMN